MFNRNTKFVKYMKLTIQISFLMLVLILLSRYEFSTFLRDKLDFSRGEFFFRGHFDNSLFFKSMAVSEVVFSLTTLLVGLVLVVPAFCWLLQILVKFVWCSFTKEKKTLEVEKIHQQLFVTNDVYLKQEKFLC